MSQILVIDDEGDVRATFAENLSGEGHAVLEAAHGAEALAVLRRAGGVDLMLLDWTMPVMNGLAFHRALRGHAGFRNIPIVVVSADPALFEHARTIGAAAALAKPVSMVTLRETVAAVLAGSRPFAPARCKPARRARGLHVFPALWRHASGRPFGQCRRP